jgi:hypothetical protein
MAAEGQTGSKMLDEMLEYRIFELLKKYHYTLTTAESATGGMIASTLINVPGISAFFTEGYVTYSNEAKVKMIHVKPETIERYGVVSAETAADMAVFVRGLPLVCGVGDGKRPGIFKGFVQKQGSSGLFLPCGGLFFQAVKHFLFCGGAFRPQGKKLRKGQLYHFGKIGLAAFKVNPTLDPHSAGRF